MFNLEVIEDDFFKDLDEPSTFYFRISRQLSYQEFVSIVRFLRNNNDPEKLNFDVALAAVYTKDVLDLIRVYCKGADLAFLKEIRNIFEKEIQKID